MTATLLLIRHAEHVDFNQRLSGRLPGAVLSERGQAQAARLAQRVVSMAPAVIWASPLIRAQQTAAAIATATRLAVETFDGLNEIDLGEWSGHRFEALAGDAGWDRWNAERDTARPPGGETMAEAQARMEPVLAEAAARFPDRAVILVTHSDMIRGAVCRMLGLAYAAVHRFDVAPASITRVLRGEWGDRLLGLNEEVA